jgi:hypothetical protein
MRYWHSQPNDASRNDFESLRRCTKSGPPSSFVKTTEDDRRAATSISKLPQPQNPYNPLVQRFHTALQ